MTRINQNLTRAKLGKNDEFYTRIKEIEDEMKHYKQHFKNKIIYCNCDDPTESKFYQHFMKLFDEYGLKLLITTCYKSDDSNLFSGHISETSYMRIYDGEREREREDSCQ